MFQRQLPLLLYDIYVDQYDIISHLLILRGGINPGRFDQSRTKKVDGPVY